MILRHTTPRKNLPGIKRAGLLTAKSRAGCRPSGFTRAKPFWATLHTIKRHGGRAEAVLILLVDVPRAWLRKNRKGLWYCTQDIPPDRIRRVLSFAELAGACAA